MVHVGRELFVATPDRETAKRWFALNVVRVEMETHSYCNRRCTYCPNVVGDRLGENNHLAPELWEKVLSGLAEIDYSNNLILNYYNEPLADRSILERIAEARVRAPRARIMIYTNGDYLDPAYVGELAAAGLDYMHVSIHMKRGETYTDRYALNRMLEIAARTGLRIQVEQIRSGEFMFAKAPYPCLEVEVRGINFHRHGTDRGGLIDEIKTASRRTAPCFFPFAHFVLGYDGSIAPCCHIRSDRPEHAPYVLGNLRDFETIFQAFMSARAAAWRREVGPEGAKRSPCDTCAAGLVPGTGGQTFDALVRRFAPEERTEAGAG